jgi:hypothetical protein
VTAFEEPGTTLKSIAMDCLEQLDAYSRYGGRYPEQRKSVAALVLLPEALLRSSIERVLPDLGNWLETTLQDSIASVDVGTLFEKCFATTMKGSLRKKEAVVLAEFLERLDIGIEPDPRLGMLIPVHASVALFRLKQQGPRSVSDSYSAAAMALSLSAVVWGAGKAGVPADDADFEREICSAFELSEGEMLRLRARRQWIANTGLQLASLRKAIGALSAQTREAVGDILLKLVHTAGEISPSKIDLLLQVYRLLRLNPEHVYSAIHAYAAGPVSLPRTQTHPARYRSHPPSQTPDSSDVAIDMDTVRAKTSESEQVSVLLRGIFVEEDQPGASEARKTQNVFGLDDRHSDFLTRILAKENWSRADLAALAAKCQVLFEGALDTLNDLALERYGDPLLEGEDPIYLNPMIAKEMNDE